MKRPLPADLLRRASTHVGYEIEQLSNSYTLLRNVEWWAAIDAPAFMAQTAHNALVESFATHDRNLDVFLHEAPKGDDMWAGDWFPPGEWDSIREPQDSGALRAARRRVNKEVAHLTYARVSVGSPVWPHQEVVEHLRADLFLFVDRVDQSLVTEGFKGATWQALPWPDKHPGPILRADGSFIRPVATSGFGPS